MEGVGRLRRAKESLHRPEHSSKKAQDLGHSVKRHGGMGRIGMKEKKARKTGR